MAKAKMASNTMNNNFDPAFHIDEDGPRVPLIRAKIHAWLTSPWFIELVNMWGGDLDPASALDSMLESLEKFSDRWDFRRIAREQGLSTDDQVIRGQGSARWLSASTGLSLEMETRIIECATQLGLVQTTLPTQLNYDFLIVLGGARLSCLLRSTMGADILLSGVRARSVALLGAARPIPDSERDATETYAPGAADEFDLIVAGAQKAFGLDVLVRDEERYNHPNNQNLSWKIQRFMTTFADQSLPIVAMSAPSSDPTHRRANSADTMVFLLDREHIPVKSRLLLITSQIYVPYVQIEAIRTVALPRDLIVETIGVGADRLPPLQGLSKPNHYLQEIRSAIQAARRFCQTFR